MNFLVLICLWSCSSWLSPALPLSPPFLHISFAFHAPSLFLVHLIFKQNDEPAGQEKKNAERGQMREDFPLNFPLRFECACCSFTATHRGNKQRPPAHCAHSFCSFNFILHQQQLALHCCNHPHPSSGKPAGKPPESPPWNPPRQPSGLYVLAQGVKSTCANFIYSFYLHAKCVRVYFIVNAQPKKLGKNMWKYFGEIILSIYLFIYRP